MRDPQFIGGVLIIGFGNALRGDDALGILAAQRLEALLVRGEGEAQSGGSGGSEAPGETGGPVMMGPVTVIACHQLTPELAEPVSRTGLVIFLDAAADLPAGQVACDPILPAPSAHSLGHALAPAGLLALAQALYGASPEAILMTGGLATTAVGADLSSPAAGALDQMVRRARAIVEGHHDLMARS